MALLAQGHAKIYYTCIIIGDIGCGESTGSSPVKKPAAVVSNGASSNVDSPKSKHKLSQSMSPSSSLSPTLTEQAEAWSVVSEAGGSYVQLPDSERRGGHFQPQRQMNMSHVAISSSSLEVEEPLVAIGELGSGIPPDSPISEQRSGRRPRRRRARRTRSSSSLHDEEKSAELVEADSGTLPPEQHSGSRPPRRNRRFRGTRSSSSLRDDDQSTELVTVNEAGHGIATPLEQHSGHYPCRRNRGRRRTRSTSSLTPVQSDSQSVELAARETCFEAQPDSESVRQPTTFTIGGGAGPGFSSSEKHSAQPRQRNTNKSHKISSCSSLPASAPGSKISADTVQHNDQLSSQVDIAALESAANQTSCNVHPIGSTDCASEQKHNDQIPASHTARGQQRSSGKPKRGRGSACYEKPSDKQSIASGVQQPVVRSKRSGRVFTRKSEHSHFKVSGALAEKQTATSKGMADPTVGACSLVKAESIGQENTNEASVIIQLSPPLLEQVSEEKWTLHFKEYLEAIKLVYYFQPEKKAYNILVVFGTISSAKDAIESLNGSFLCGLYQMTMSLEPGSTHCIMSHTTSGTCTAAVASRSNEAERRASALIAEIRGKRSQCKQKNEKEVSKLMTTKKEAKRAEKAAAGPRPPALVGSSIRVIRRRNEEEKEEMKEHLVTECNRRKEVFLWLLQEIEAQVYHFDEALALHTNEEMQLLHAKFVRECKRYDKALPIFAHRQDIMKIIRDYQVCVLVGETGSGKSTQLVQYLYEAGYASNGLIVCTQPRKLAAISLAEHVSKEVDERVGDTYGYLVTKGKQSANTKVLFMTDHTLLNECIADPNLSKYSCLVIDEAHERSIHTDILIAFIKRCLPNRPDLKVVITSATIDPTVFSAYFHGCPIIKVPGRTYPVDIKWDPIKWEKPEQPMAERDYVQASVEQVCNLRLKIKQRKASRGDILVFLTCPAEIEKACKLAHERLKNEAVILPLHGKLQPEDQNKIFKDTPTGKTKVVFSTNLAETSVTIPGIVYVIDTGLSKELCYDPQKNMNSLEIRPISKSSADQRKGRAGRTCPGECYRLYPEGDYADMRDNSVPEIMRITLAFAVIKLYEFGIANIHSFEFVESPDRKALDEAIENLKFLGAIEGGKLTTLGRKMALLPLDPNLSKILFDAISKGIGIEAAVAVSISTLSGRVFFRPENSESQEESEKMKLPFCQPSGDQMTYLHTFYEWSRQKKSEQNKWCVANYVNAKSMRMVLEIVKDLSFILKGKCRTSLRLIDAIMSLDKADDLLPKIFFNAFLRNVCVYLGHNRVGYWSERLPAEQLVLYRGSSLSCLGSVPKCVVYERTQKTSQHFLLQVLPVREEWIQEAVEAKKLPCHPAEASLFMYHQVSTSESLTFTNLGPTLSLKLQQKYPYDRRNVVLDFHFEVQPVFEHFRDQGVFRVFAQSCYHDEVQEKVTNFIDTFKKELKDESYKCGLTANTDDTKMVIGQGGCIQSILMPGEFHTIVVRGLNEDQFDKAAEELESLGDCTSKLVGDQLFIKYEDPSDAATALAYELTSIFHSRRIRIHNYRERYKNNFCLKVEWERRERLDFAYVNFEERLDDDIAALIRHRLNRPINRSGLCFVLWRRDIEDEEDDTFSIRVRNVSKDTTEEQITSTLLSCLPTCADTKFSIHFIYSKSFEETEEIYHGQKNDLDTLLSRFALKSSYDISFNRPYSRTVMYRAFVYFDDSITCWKTFQRLLGNTNAEQEDESDKSDLDLESEPEDTSSTVSTSATPNEATNSESDAIPVDSISHSEVNTCNSSEDSCSESDESDFFYSCEDESEDDDEYYGPDRRKSGLVQTGQYRIEPSLSSSTRYSKQVFSVIKPSIERVSHRCLSELKSTTIELQKKDRWGNTFVNVTSNNNYEFKKAQKALAKVVEPEVILFSEDKENQYVATLSFQTSVREIQEKTSTVIKINSSSLTNSTVDIYGSRMNRELAREALKSHIHAVLRDGIDCFEVHLDEVGKPGLMKHLVKTYGPDLAGFTGSFDGITATKLIPRRQVLTLFATEAGYRSFLESVKSYKPAEDIAQAETLGTAAVSSSNECCVCGESHSTKEKTFFYRLEYCGHVYCKECIELQLQPNSIRFPVTCAAENCEKPLVWKDFENLFRRKVKKRREIISSSLKSYIAENTDKFHNCITPDCQMVYPISTTTSNRRYTCRHCGASVCTSCHTTWHEGYDTCNDYKNRNELQTAQWLREDPANRKLCPNCKVHIEKAGGCQHVHCVQCNKHICWHCLEFFSLTSECYAHLSKKHGGY